MPATLRRTTRFRWSKPTGEDRCFRSTSTRKPKPARLSKPRLYSARPTSRSGAPIDPKVSPALSFLQHLFQNLPNPVFKSPSSALHDRVLPFTNDENKEATESATPTICNQNRFLPAKSEHQLQTALGMPSDRSVSAANHNGPQTAIFIHQFRIVPDNLGILPLLRLVRQRSPFLRNPGGRKSNFPASRSARRHRSAKKEGIAPEIIGNPIRFYPNDIGNRNRPKIISEIAHIAFPKTIIKIEWIEPGDIHPVEKSVRIFRSKTFPIIPFLKRFRKPYTHFKMKMRPLFRNRITASRTSHDSDSLPRANHATRPHFFPDFAQMRIKRHDRRRYIPMLDHHITPVTAVARNPIHINNHPIHHRNHRIGRLSPTIASNRLQIERFMKTRAAVANTSEKSRLHTPGNRRLNKSLWSFSIRISGIRCRPNNLHASFQPRNPGPNK